MKFFLASIIILFGVQCWAQSKQSPEFFLKVKRKKIDVILRAADFHPNDVIADVGAAEGWLDAGIAVYELLARKVGQHFRYCKKIIYTREQIIDAFVKNGFRLDQIYKTVNSNRTKVRVFTFYKS